jgi:transcription elongation factor Elf1
MKKIKCPFCGKTPDAVFVVTPFDEPAYWRCSICGKLFPYTPEDSEDESDPVNSPSHYVGKIECIDYLRDKLTKEEFTGFCMGNVLKYSSRWRKKDGLQDLKKAKVYLEWAIENEEKTEVNGDA